MVPDPRSPEPEKVRNLFDGLAANYDTFNCLASLGLDRKWRSAVAGKIGGKGFAPELLLDLGTGTGDLLLAIRKAGDPQDRRCVYLGADVSLPMLLRARKKFPFGMYFFQADSRAIPLLSGSVDVVVSAFVLRNIKPFLRETLADVSRILRPGGRIYFLDLYVPENLFLRALYKIYVNMIMPVMGRAVFGRSWSGSYLSETIANMGSPDSFSLELENAGFRNVGHDILSGGIAVLHFAQKA